MQERMVPEHLVADALRGWLLVQFQQGHYPAQGQLSQELLYWGKVLFIARCIAPELPLKPDGLDTGRMAMGARP